MDPQLRGLQPSKAVILDIKSMLCDMSGDCHAWPLIGKSVLHKISRYRESRADVLQCPLISILLPPYIGLLRSQIDRAWFSAALEVLGGTSSEDLYMYPEVAAIDFVGIDPPLCSELSLGIDLHQKVCETDSTTDFTDSGVSSSSSSSSSPPETGSPKAQPPPLHSSSSSSSSNVVGCFRMFNPLPRKHSKKELSSLHEDLARQVGEQPNIANFHLCSFLMPSKIDSPEHVTGEDLHCAVTRSRLSELQARHIMNGLLLALGHLHKHGLVHRDVKPENVLVAADGAGILADFNLCTQVSDRQAMRLKCGSPGYMAPEMWLGMRYDIKVDSFSAGVLLYFALSGEVLFRGSSVHSVMRLTTTSEVSFSQCMQLSERCRDFITSLLRKQPQYRPTASKALCSVWFELTPSESVDSTLSSSTASGVGSSANTETTLSLSHAFGVREQHVLERPVTYKTTFTHLDEIDETAEEVCETAAEESGKSLRENVVASVSSSVSDKSFQFAPKHPSRRESVQSNNLSSSTSSRGCGQKLVASPEADRGGGNTFPRSSPLTRCRRLVAKP